MWLHTAMDVRRIQYKQNEDMNYLQCVYMSRLNDGCHREIKVRWYWLTIAHEKMKTADNVESLPLMRMRTAKVNKLEPNCQT